MSYDHLDEWADSQAQRLFSGSAVESTKVDPKLEQQLQVVFHRVLTEAGRDELDAAHLSVFLGPQHVEFRFSSQRLLSEWDGTDEDLRLLVERFAESLIEEG